MSDILSGNSLIVADARHIEPLRAGAIGGRLEAASFLPLPADAPLSDRLLAKTRVLVLEVDAESDASLRRLATVRAHYPDLAVIAAVQQAGVALVRALVRQGVSDVAELPFVAQQLEDQVLDALSSQTEKRAHADLGKAVAVVGATGGCGATSVLTHLAAVLAKENPGQRGVCLIDLDLQKGSIASFLGIDPTVTIQNLIDSGARLDRELMLSAVIDSGRGFSLIAAPNAISPIDRIDVDHLLAIVSLARAEFDYVLIDLPPLWTDWTLSLISWANHVSLLTDSSIANLRQAKRTATLLGSVDVPASRISLIVNRMERKLFGATKIDDVARALGREEVISIADAGPSLRAAQDQGLLLPALQGKTKFAGDVSRLADRILSGEELS
ncbi:AAA family ATPase [Tsuneonella sp. HG249]